MDFVHKKCAPGPWQDEPDRVQWEDKKTYYRCLVLRNINGSLCGYVGVPRNHPACVWDAEEAEARLRAHGGVNFAGPSRGVICYLVDEAAGPELDVKWFGFDCGHGMDYCPIWSTTFFSKPVQTERYRDLKYVIDQVQELAMQLLQLELDQ